MSSILFIILRRMRLPLILLIVSYAICILGLALVPGVDAEGHPAAPLSFFHAFYFISYTATTIGFGEIPVAFSDGQRAWVIVSLYITVTVWLYSIGTILTLLQDPAFRRSQRHSRMRRKCDRLRQPFYILCGCGETGSTLLQALDARNTAATVLDIEPKRIGDLEIGQYNMDFPALAADVRNPENLEIAGLWNPNCAGVIALTADDQANLSVAVTVKLLRPELPVLSRVDQMETAHNLLAFGTDEIVSAFEVFGEHMSMALNTPGHHMLYEWLTDVPGNPLSDLLEPPRGKWVICSYGRFGRAVVRQLNKEGVETVVVEANPQKMGCTDCVVGTGAETPTLIEAGIMEAAGIVAGTDDDIKNLAILMTARELRPDIFTVIRQNRRGTGPLFKRAKADVTMHPSNIIAHEFLLLLNTPLLSRFFSASRQLSNDWANELLSRIIAVVGETVPEVWDLELNCTQAEAVCIADKEGEIITMHDLIRDPADRDEYLAIVPLLLLRENRETLLPSDETRLMVGDRVLFCGQPGIRPRQDLALRNHVVLNYLLSGCDLPGGTVWRWFGDCRKRRAKATA